MWRDFSLYWLQFTAETACLSLHCWCFIQQFYLVFIFPATLCFFHRSGSWLPQYLGCTVLSDLPLAATHSKTWHSICGSISIRRRLGAKGLSSPLPQCTPLVISADSLGRIGPNKTRKTTSEQCECPVQWERRLCITLLKSAPFDLTFFF